MPTLAEMEAAARMARKRYEEARQRVAVAEREAQEAIRAHAEVQVRVIGGAGMPADVDTAAAERDAALAQLAAVRAELGVTG